MSLTLFLGRVEWSVFTEWFGDVDTEGFLEMSNIVEMSKEEMRELSIDFDSHESVQNGLASLSGKVAGRDKRNARAKYVIAVGADRMVVDYGMTAENVASVVGMAPGTFSKLRTLAKVARYAVSDRGDDSPYDKKLESMVWNLTSFWSFATNGQNAGSLAKNLMLLIGDDGENRADAVRNLYGVIGSTEDFYNVANGKRLHDDDPRKVVGSGDDESGDGDDESGDDPKVSGEELLTRGVRKCREQGMSDTDIAAFVMGLLGK